MPLIEPRDRPTDVAIGRFTHDPKVLPHLERGVAELRHLIEDPSVPAGTLHARTSTALKGARVRAVHRDTVDQIGGDPGSFIDVGTADGPLLRIQAFGEDAPLTDLSDPRAGMSRLLAAFDPIVRHGIVDGPGTSHLDTWTDATTIMVDAAIRSGLPWRACDSLHMRFATGLAPFRIDHVAYDVVSTVTRIDHLVEDDDPIRAIPGGMRVVSTTTPSPFVTIHPWTEIAGGDAVHAPSPVEIMRARLRIQSSIH